MSIEENIGIAFLFWIGFMIAYYIGRKHEKEARDLEGV